MADNNIDPSISLGVKTPEAVSPFGMLNSLMPMAKNAAEIGNIGSEIQSRQLSNTMQYRTILGQNALAEAARAATDPNTGEIDQDKWISLAAQNPYTAPMAGQLASQLRQAQQFQLEAAAKKQEMVKGAMGDIFSDVAVNARNNDRGTAAKAMVAARFNSLPTMIQQQIGKPTLDYLTNTIFSDLPDDPKEASQIVKQRTVPLALKYLGKDALEYLYGRAETRDQGNVRQNGRVDLFTGDFTPVGAPMPIGIPPGYTGAESVLHPGIPGAGFNALGGGGMGAPAGAPPMSGPTNQLGGAMAPAPTPQPQLQPPQQPPSGPVSFLTGRPFPIPDDTRLLGAATTAGGQKLMRDESNRLPKDQVDVASREYQNAQGALQNIQTMKEDMKKLGADGWYAPGTTGQFRQELANLGNTIGGMIPGWKKDSVFDPEKIGAMEDVTKNNSRLSLQFLTSVLGVQREAAQTIQSTMKAVPGLENSPFGARLVMAGVEALLRRNVDRWQFMQQYDTKHGFMSNQADTEFNAANPPEAYVSKLRSDLGLGADGKFVDPAALKRAVRDGWMRQDQAKQIAAKQFGTPAQAAAKGHQF